MQLPRRFALVVAAGAIAACGSTGLSDEVLATVVDEVMDAGTWASHGVTVTDVEVTDVTRLDPDADDDRETWCVAVDAATSDPEHYLDDPMIWLASQNDDGTWWVTPTFIIAVKHTDSWHARCGIAEPLSGES